MIKTRKKTNAKKLCVLFERQGRTKKSEKKKSTQIKSPSLLYNSFESYSFIPRVKERRLGESARKKEAKQKKTGKRHTKNRKTKSTDNSMRTQRKKENCSRYLVTEKKVPR